MESDVGEEKARAGVVHGVGNEDEEEVVKEHVRVMYLGYCGVWPCRRVVVHALCHLHLLAAHRGWMEIMCLDCLPEIFRMSERHGLGLTSCL